ncbi:MAG TPA: ABC transporter permease [Solirubrobacteraceae bacterium]|nr:ABC transporter permease [Solirubrobacteraceae bacterium]
MILATGKAVVIPNFGGSAYSCERHNPLFCVDWVSRNWDTVLWPALRQHIVLTVIAVAIGFAISTALALAAYRVGWVERPVVVVTLVLYTIPSIALFELLVGIPWLGLSTATAEVALVSYTLLILFRNILTGLREVPEEVRDAARGMGMSARQMLWRVELPLALPAIIAGLRIATVTVISLATIAPLISVESLGTPIFAAISNNLFKTELIAAGGMAVLLAVAADGAFVLVQRRLAPWARVRVR